MTFLMGATVNVGTNDSLSLGATANGFFRALTCSAIAPLTAGSARRRAASLCL